MRKRSGEKGAVMVMAAASLTMLLLFAGLALDFGRAHLLRAQLQTAVDAASLAGALQVIPYADLEIKRWKLVRVTEPDPVTKKPYTYWDWVPASHALVSGPERQLLSKDGWRAAAGAQCQGNYECEGPPQIVREWLVLGASTKREAINAFNENAQWPQGNFSPHVVDLTVTTEENTAQVGTSATITVPTSFLKLVGIRELRITRYGSAVPHKR